MSSNTTAATLPAHRLKDATPNDSSSDLSDQEPAGLGDDQLSSLPPTAAPNMANRGRRTSVSAESMNPTYSSENGSPGSDPTEQGRMEKVVIPKTQQQKDRIRQSIQNNFLFRNLDEEQYREVVDAMAELKVAVGTEVIKQGAIGDYFYIVETGSLDVFVQRQGQAQPHKVTAYGPGGSFGELALMYNAPRAATVTATNECILWALDRVTFRRILMESTNRRRRMYEQFLEEVPLLKSLESYERHKIADALESVTFESGHVVMRQGDMGDQFYIVESGEAKVTQVDDKGVEQVVAVLKKGQYFGGTTHHPWLIR